MANKIVESQQHGLRRQFTDNGDGSYAEKITINTAADRLHENFETFDTSTIWEVISASSNMTVSGPLGGNATGSSRYLNIASGTMAGDRFTILSRGVFKPPFNLRFQITASQRIANAILRIGVVEVDKATGDIVTAPPSGFAPDRVLDARNACLIEYSGTNASTQYLLTRGGGAATDVITAGVGTVSTVATGTSPNFIVPSTYQLAVEREGVYFNARFANTTIAPGNTIVSDRVYPDPTKTYKIVISVENDATAPASSVDWRLHVVDLIDISQVDVSPKSFAVGDPNRSFPVTGSLVTTSLPSAPSPTVLNSAASTNVLLMQGTPGSLHGIYATNTGAAAAYVKLFNKSSAPVLGTDVPSIILPVPAAVGGVPGVAQLISPFVGYRFTNGMGIAITGGSADSDTTAVAAGQVKLMLSRIA